MTKKLILFTNDEALANVFTEFFAQHPFEAHLVNVALDKVDFTNSVIILDYDVVGMDMRTILTNIVRAGGQENKVIVVSQDCERRNISDVAKSGATRFIVKPINKKRIKKYILPYLEYASQVSV